MDHHYYQKLQLILLLMPLFLTSYGKINTEDETVWKKYVSMSNACGAANAKRGKTKKNYLLFVFKKLLCLYFLEHLHKEERWVPHSTLLFLFLGSEPAGLSLQRSRWRAVLCLDWNLLFFVQPQRSLLGVSSTKLGCLCLRATQNHFTQGGGKQRGPWVSRSQERTSAGRSETPLSIKQLLCLYLCVCSRTSVCVWCYVYMWRDVWSWSWR